MLLLFKYMLNQNNISLKASLRKTLPKQAFVFSQEDLQRLKSLSQVALAIIASAGIVTAAIIAPNIFKVFKTISKFKKALRKTNAPTETIAKTFYYLKKHDYIKMTKSGKDYFVEITQKGKKKLQKMNFQKLKVPKSNSWDGNWWIVLADIPSKDYRHQADLLREKVKNMGFYLLQRTVWVFPFDTRAEIAFVAKYYGIDRFLTVIQTHWIDEQDDAVLKQYFGLK